ncbi:aminotransferase class V-fold PLP-dependent enzyme [Synoicihabitans lomoniglobus]|uniref:Aminotransferase class V-fold PLP-dependent enzyme n=1 Tax=Synoicihabitans lomoniglobus TaxID=2909285 RepID=A0AAF0I4S5_9BACT|nr:aminotransferase class V-fold PLP-dependent enzyme [Opitutaceae bacterium LMO-M01]WED66974.1 aminotransferase class V-fold PLP-dependent enzyme [Opitutaceae bacterium LMO-M01]
MTLNRKAFLKRCGLGLAGLGASKLLAAPASLPESLRPYSVAAGDDYWSAMRAAYDFDPGLHYFNTGGLGPSPAAIKSFTAQVAEELQWHVETGHGRIHDVRGDAARFLGAAEDEVSFVRNATEGNGIVAGGLDLQRGDEVIFESHAHPGGSFPWLLQAQQKGVAVRLFEPDPTSPEGNLQRIEALMTRRTRVVQVSHITAPTGIVMPVASIAKLCEAHGVWFHIDGAQSAGMIPVDFAAMGCDSYATSGHKWLGGPRESGMLVVRRARQDELVPPLVGAYSGEVENLPGSIEFTPNAGRYEYGTRDVARELGLVEAMRWQTHIGRDAIARHGRELAERLRAGLTPIPDLEILTPTHADLRASMLTIRSERLGYRELFGALWSRHRMRCRPVSEQGLDAVRVSCHAFNTIEEIDALIAAVEQELRAA